MGAIKNPFHTKSYMYLELGESLNEDGRKELNRKRLCLSFRRKTVQNLSQLLMPWCNELKKFRVFLKDYLVPMLNSKSDRFTAASAAVRASTVTPTIRPGPRIAFSDFQNGTR